MTTCSRCQRGFTLIELLIVVAIIGILAAIAIPGLLRARMSANEANAIEAVRGIHRANAIYFSLCGGYAVQISTLYNGNYLPEEFNANPVIKSGYQVGLVAGNAAVPAGNQNGVCAGAQSTYFASARPVTVGTTGQRAFGIREWGTIVQDTSGAALVDAAQGPVLGGTITVLN